MTTPQLALTDELSVIRAEISRLRLLENTLASIQRSFPTVPVVRIPPMSREATGIGHCMAAAHV